MPPALDEVAKYVQGLRPTSGNNFIGFCPLHGEVAGQSMPSFSFNAATGQWNCFAGCGAGGLPSLLRELGFTRIRIDRTMERLRPFLQAVERKASIATRPNAFCTPYPLAEKILGLYEYCPAPLIDAGFEEKILESHDIGFDFNNNRMTFPFRDLAGNLAGISGRDVTGQSNMKYKVYEHEIRELGYPGYHVDNHDFFWRADRVYPRVYSGQEGLKPDRVIVVEGFKACLWCVQHGYENTIALMGSSISDTQTRLLERLGPNVVLFLDNNRAGRNGTAKISYRVRGCSIHVVEYPSEEVQQPDQLGPYRLHVAIETAVSINKWRRNHGYPINGPSRQRPWGKEAEG